MKKLTLILFLISALTANAQDLTHNNRKVILNSANSISLFQTNSTSGIWASGIINGDRWGIFEDATSLKERLTVLAGGNVGIGTNSPLEKLQVGNSFAFHDGGHKVLGFLYSSSGTDLDTSKYAAEIRLDPTYGNLRLGTSPDVNGAPVTRMTIDKLGRVAIGTTYTSNGVLTVNGNASTSIRIENDVNSQESSIRFRVKNASGSFYHSDISSFYDGNNGIIGIKAPHNNTPGVGYDFVVNSFGNVGIGTTSPDAKLAVSGEIHAKEVKVDLVGWPDYVFKKDYNLPTLEEVEKHITEKGHLINMPSAEKVAVNGIQLGEMNKLLLEKIEELTLYILEQDKQIKALKELDKRLLKIEQMTKD
ncbi:hypothetical protein HZY62_13450 [Maribacter polysiphoniae]|uniref:Endosialidase-like protein n=1 Tax=Maribacter polysiphoniae TaxID=429344 RepID=A0A316DZD9_9FLAO|nr:tail fiber protein [Maribacter polysiphoniae]MBD1261604.1 hypothetical protein [Maribacter polysiphoniae]PWK22599.1 hypothetical protein LX92_03074 [Maribacter polysiphoniae]